MANSHLLVKLMSGGTRRLYPAWRWYIPDDLKFIASNNLLEHIAAVISPWVDILAGWLQSQDCVLSTTDSTTAEGWLKKSNFSKLGEFPLQSSVRIKAARKQATFFMFLGIKSYSQWFKGAMNKVSDALSRDNDQNDKALTNIFCQFCPSQILSHFKIVPLPKEITSWLIGLLQKLSMNQLFKEKHTRSKLGHGTVGESTISSLETRTSSWNTSPGTSKSISSELLPWLCMKDSFQDQLMISWLRAQSQVPFKMYVRTSEKMASQIVPLTKMWDLASFYSNSIGPSAKQTQHKSIRKQSQYVSLPRSEKLLSQGSRLPFSNSLALQSSLHVNLANISKSQQKSRAKQQSFASKT